MWIIKRNGLTQEFDKNKIRNAILKAIIATGEDKNKAEKVIEKTIKQVKDNDLVTSVYLIEELIFDNLIEEGLTLTAKAYEGYRAVQAYRRVSNTIDDSILGLVNRTNKEVMEENSNKNALISSTQRDLIAGEVSKDIARRKLIPAHIIQAHDDGILHNHDMDYVMQPIHNCSLINLEDMLQNGTVINGKMVEKPKSFATACTITTQIIAQIASGQYGGCSITIKHLAPFLKISGLKRLRFYENNGVPYLAAIELVTEDVKNELKAGIQTIRYQLSTLNTSNGQAPFVTIYLEIEEGSEYEKEQALICEEMIKQRLEGMKNEKGQEIGETFPKLVYLLDKHNCLEGGKYDYITKLAAKCSVKRLVPDYQSAKIMRMNYDGETFPPINFVA